MLGAFLAQRIYIPPPGRGGYGSSRTPPLVFFSGLLLLVLAIVAMIRAGLCAIVAYRALRFGAGAAGLLRREPTPLDAAPGNQVVMVRGEAHATEDAVDPIDGGPVAWFDLALLARVTEGDVSRGHAGAGAFRVGRGPSVLVKTVDEHALLQLEPSEWVGRLDALPAGVQRCVRAHFAAALEQLGPGATLCVRRRVLREGDSVTVVGIAEERTTVLEPPRVEPPAQPPTAPHYRDAPHPDAVPPPATTRLTFTLGGTAVASTLALGAPEQRAFFEGFVRALDPGELFGASLPREARARTVRGVVARGLAAAVAWFGASGLCVAGLRWVAGG